MSTITAYHGSSAEFDQADTNHGHGKTKGLGLFLTDSKNIAQTYAGSNGHIYEFLITLNNPLEIDFEGANWNSFDYEGNATSYFIIDAAGNELDWFSNLADAEFAESNYDQPVKIEKDVDPDKTYSTDDIARMAKNEGHDGVIIYNVIDSANSDVHNTSTVYVVFDNDSIINSEILDESNETVMTESHSIFFNFISNFYDADPNLIESIVAGYITAYRINVSSLTEASNKQKYEVPHIEGKSPIKTNIPPEDRTMDNIPRFSTGKLKVKFQDWLGIKSGNGVGKSTNGKWYGWSHRAMYGFGIGDKIKKGDCAYNGKEYTIKTEQQAKKAAERFSDSVS